MKYYIKYYYKQTNMTFRNITNLLMMLLLITILFNIKEQLKLHRTFIYKTYKMVRIILRNIDENHPLLNLTDNITDECY